MPGAKSHITAKLNDFNLNKAAKAAPPAARPGVQFGGNFKNSPLNANKGLGRATNQAAKTVVDAINKQVPQFV